jgi:hypothetical protein
MRWKTALLSMAFLATLAGAQEAAQPAEPAAETDERIVVGADALDRDQPESIEEAMKLEHDTFMVKGSLKTALSLLSELGSVQIAVDWDGLTDIGVTAKTAVLLRADGQTTQRILELLLAQASPKNKPIAWRLDGNVIRVSSRAVIVRANSTPRPARRRRNPLTTPLALTFDQIPFEDALDAVAKTAGVSMHVSWRALEGSGIERLTPVSVEVEGLTMTAMLDLLVEEASPDMDKFDSAYWYVEDGIIRVTTGRAMNQKLITRTFHIGDLLMVAPNFAGPRIDMAYVTEEPGSGGSIFADDEDEEETPAERRRATKKAILESITSLLDDDMWKDGGGKGSVRILRDQLIVSQTRLGYLLMARNR